VTRIDQSDLYRRNSAVFKNFVLYSPDPPSVHTEGLGTRLGNTGIIILLPVHFLLQDGNASTPSKNKIYRSDPRSGAVSIQFCATGMCKLHVQVVYSGMEENKGLISSFPFVIRYICNSVM